MYDKGEGFAHPQLMT